MTTNTPPKRPRTQLVFSGLPPALVTTLEDEMDAGNMHPLVGMTHVEAIRHPAGLVLRLNEGAAGYTFCRNTYGAENDVDLFRHFLQDPVQSLYMYIPYEVKEQSHEVVLGIMERYQNYGTSHAAKIDWAWYERSSGKHLLILRVPKEIVRGMMWRHGGTLATTVRGTAAALRQLPVLSQIVPKEAADTERLQRAFVTPYGNAEQYDQCMAVHQTALREVLAAGAIGVCLGPIAAWTP